MTLTLNPETEEKIAAHAREFGMTADQYAAQIIERELAIDAQRMSAKEFLRRGPRQPDIKAGWPGQEGEAGNQTTVLLPPSRPTADEFLADVMSIAGTDRPAKDYPEDFFSREVIYADHD